MPEWLGHEALQHFNSKPSEIETASTTDETEDSIRELRGVIAYAELISLSFDEAGRVGAVTYNPKHHIKIVEAGAEPKRSADKIIVVGC